jgi:DNA polymerase V
MNDQAREIEAACSPEGGCGSDELYALMVLGDDMMPEFEDGCVIVIDPSGNADDGKYVVAEVNEEYTFRQLVIRDERFFLRSLKQPEVLEELPGGREAVKGIIVQKNGKSRRRADRKFYY